MLLTKRKVKMAGYWPSYFFFFLHGLDFHGAKQSCLKKTENMKFPFINKPVIQIPRVGVTCVIFFPSFLVDEFYSPTFPVHEFFVFVFAPPSPLKLNCLSLKPH